MTSWESIDGAVVSALLHSMPSEGHATPDSPSTATKAAARPQISWYEQVAHKSRQTNNGATQHLGCLALLCWLARFIMHVCVVLRVFAVGSCVCV